MNFPLRTPLRLAAVLCVSVLAVHATETDDRIIATARSSYNFKTYLADDTINIVSRNGEVTLTGQVLDELHRSLAEETLAGLPGVKGVSNQLNLQARTGGTTPDATLQAKVQAALLFHRSLSALKTRVQVDQGAVTLQGEADSEAQKKLATEYVKGLDGVVRVVNDMTVAGEHPRGKAIRVKIDDASITAQVKLALLFNRATSALHTKVRTDHGVVHLSGTARSKAEKALVTQIVRNLEGIKAVRNTMRVVP